MPQVETGFSHSLVLSLFFCLLRCFLKSLVFSYIPGAGSSRDNHRRRIHVSYASRPTGKRGIAVTISGLSGINLLIHIFIRFSKGILFPFFQIGQPAQFHIVAGFARIVAQSFIDVER